MKGNREINSKLDFVLVVVDIVCFFLLFLSVKEI